MDQCVINLLLTSEAFKTTFVACVLNRFKIHTFSRRLNLGLIELISAVDDSTAA